VASKWEFCTISMKSSSRVVMFAKEVHFRVVSCLFLFKAQSYTHITTQSKRGWLLVLPLPVLGETLFCGPRDLYT
jgi:hypothetical protein